MLALLLVCSLAPCIRSSFPGGPTQQCADDAGPPWGDDGPVAYYEGFLNAPVLPPSGSCPPALSSACAAKGALAAYMDGPIDCGGKGWFCRLTDQPGHRAPGATATAFPDSNFASCNQSNTDHDRDGHCHGSDHDDVYGWWIRDHWHRNYAGSLKCCCGWQATVGVVNRCDYRAHVRRRSIQSCRDANEEHDVNWNPGCTATHFANFKEPPEETCWHLTSFGPATLTGRRRTVTSKAPASTSGAETTRAPTSTSKAEADCFVLLASDRKLHGRKTRIWKKTGRNSKAVVDACRQKCSQEVDCDVGEVKEGKKTVCVLWRIRYNWNEASDIRIKRKPGWEVYYDACKLRGKPERRLLLV